MTGLSEMDVKSGRQVRCWSLITPAGVRERAHVSDVSMLFAHRTWFSGGSLLSSVHPLFSETRRPEAKVKFTTCLNWALAPPSRWNKFKSSNPAFVQNRKQVRASRSVEDRDPQLELGRITFLRPMWVSAGVRASP